MIETKYAETKYTAPFTVRQVAAAQVGAVFYDKGVKMRITRVGKPYIDGSNRPAFDAWAVPVEKGKQ